jgi:FKBP-type peptidyl-prolyl cis-trans isomerase
LISEEEGFGPPAADGDLVTIKYRLTTPQGRVILEDDEYSFVVGTNSVIEGIEETVVGMRRRGKRVADCPPHKHWGRPGYGNGAVPPDTHLVIEVELLDKD